MADNSDTETDGEVTAAADGYVPDSDLGQPGGRAPIIYRGEDALPIPRREDLVARAAGPNVDRHVRERKPVFFLPVDIEEQSDYHSGEARYAVHMFGPLLDGSRAHVVVEGVEPHFDVRVPDGTPPGEFEPVLRAQIAAAGLYDFRLEALRLLPWRGYRREPVPYVRVHCRELAGRKKALEAAREARYETADDDRKSYYRAFARHQRLPLTDWLVIQGYRVTEGPSAEAPCCRFLFRLAASGVQPLFGSKRDEEYRRRVPGLTHDRTLVCTWDIETQNGRGAGDLPTAEHPEDRCRALCMTLHWGADPAPCYRLCLAQTAACEPDPRWDTVLCRTEADLFRAFGLALQALQPDILAGFNDADYDWPFAYTRMRQQGQLGEFLCHASALPRRHTNESAAEWNVREFKVKISADQTVPCRILRVPGILMVDVRVCFERLFPRAEVKRVSSLRFYLAACGLPGKADMPLKRLQRIFVEDDTGAQSPPVRAAHMREVLYYCSTDALRCQQLLVRRGVVVDRREVSALAYTSLADAFYQADGMKTCNMLAAVAFERGIACTLVPPEEDGRKDKYPGAWVFPPRKGLHRRRPVVGLDFSSLYPSLFMAYNISPEKFVATDAEAEALRGAGLDLHYVEFPFRGAPVRGWFVRHGMRDADVGLYPAILIGLFAKRKAIKKALEPIAFRRETIELLQARAKSGPPGPAAADLAADFAADRKSVV